MRRFLNENRLHQIISETINRYLVNEIHMADKEGSLSNLCMKFLADDCAVLRKCGSLAAMKEYIKTEVGKLKGTSPLEKKKFLNGNIERGYTGVLGADSFTSLQIRIANVFSGGDGFSNVLHRRRKY